MKKRLICLGSLGLAVVAGGIYVYKQVYFRLPDDSAQGAFATFVEGAQIPDGNSVNMAIFLDQLQATTQQTTEALKADDIKQALTARRATFDCTLQNCFYAAVDKLHGLPSSYEPEVEAIENQYLHKDAAAKMHEFLSVARQNGIEAGITSGYRSYKQQQWVFGHWTDVQKQRNPTLTHNEAEARANEVSAYPGHSEHQLGTTADLNTAGAEFSNHQQNAVLYRFIEDHAHEYGFVISYPKGMQHITGYAHEPWHVRYIGVDLATELYNSGYTKGQGNYSAYFLRYKGLSR